MVSRGSDRIVLWPRYFDIRLSRAEGRRVPKDLAVRNPDAGWIESAAKKAGLDVVLEEAPRHPALPHKKSGRVLVKRSGGKEATIRAVAQRMATESPTA